MRTILPALLVVLSALPATAGMTLEQMRARLKDVEAELKDIATGIHVDSLESVRAELRDLDRKRFENDLELARINARREVVLIRAKEEEARNRAESDVLQRKLDSLSKQRSMIQNEMAAKSEKVDAGKLLPQEVTSLKLQLIKLDEETATLEYQMSGGGSQFSDALAEMEIDLAGINAMRKVIDSRTGDFKSRYTRLASFPEAQDKLLKERDLLLSEIERLSSRKP